MLSASQFRELVSGRRRGPLAAVLRAGLALAEQPYAAAIRRRNARYDDGAAETHAVDVPVVSVGNLTVGGTGKTPAVAWIVRWYCARGAAPAIVSRGYGAAAGSVNDEARELATQAPGVPHFQDADRVAAARRAVAAGATLIVLDDAFQHRRLARDLDIVLLDAHEPFGYGRLLPRGLLREPVAGLARAQVVILTRADQVAPGERARIHAEAARHAPQATWAEAIHAPEHLLAAGGRQAPLVSLRGLRVAAFCGVGNPAGFRGTLNECGCRVVGMREFPDHHLYRPTDRAALVRWARSLDAEALLCTQKDLVKLNDETLEGLPLWALVIGFEFIAGRADVESQLARLLPRAMPGYEPLV